LLEDEPLLGVEVVVLGELAAFEAAGLEVVVVLDEALAAGVAVADDFAGETLADGVAVPIGVVVALAAGVAVAVAEADGVAVAEGEAVAAGDIVALGVAVANGVAVALAAGDAVGAVCPAIPDCVVTPLRPPPPRLMLIPAAGCTP
jgi:hypothetical protein